MSGLHEPLLSSTEIRKLTLLQREVLVSHVGGDQPVIRGPAWQTPKLIDLKCLRAINGGRITTLTERGRHAAAVILGEYADALVAAGCLEPDVRPIDMLARLKADKRPEPDTPAELAAIMAADRSPARL